MKVLALDSSTEWVGVAACDAGTSLLREERAAAANSQRILPLVDAVLVEAGWRLADLDGIAYGAGPGAFTGVRIACGVAQGLGLGADRPLVGIGTLEALAQAAWQTCRAARVFACLDARMREVYTAAYVRGGGQWREAAPPAVVAPADVLRGRAFGDGDWYGAGNGFAAYPALKA